MKLHSFVYKCMYMTRAACVFFESVKSEFALETIHIRRRLFLRGEGSKFKESSETYLLELTLNSQLKAL